MLGPQVVLGRQGSAARAASPGTRGACGKTGTGTRAPGTPAPGTSSAAAGTAAAAALAPQGRPGRAAAAARAWWRRVVLCRSRQRVHHRQRRARRSRRLLGRGDRARVDGDGDLDRAAELLRQRVDDQGPELGLQVLLHERVGGSDQRRVLHEAERPGQPEPGELACLESHPGEPVKGPCPHLRQINVTHRWLPSPRSRARVAIGSIRQIANRNSLSTGSSTRCVRRLRCGFPIRGGSQLPEGVLRTLIFHSLSRRRWIRCGNRGAFYAAERARFDLCVDHPYR